MNETTTRASARLRRTALAACLLAASWACMPSAPSQATPPAPPSGAYGRLSTHHTTDSNGTVPLRDAAGNTIARGSTTPYSPERTCGGCHAVDVITQGYHFQQGRTNADGSMRVSDTFNPVKSWLLSDGMYGKT